MAASMQKCKTAISASRSLQVPIVVRKRRYLAVLAREKQQHETVLFAGCLLAVAAHRVA
jgi:hypothetical protein